jgi:hypothetical protein
MVMEFTTEEIRDLKDALESRRRGLMEELVHTDDRELHATLREQVERLERLVARTEQSDLVDELQMPAP